MYLWQSGATGGRLIFGLRAEHLRRRENTPHPLHQRKTILSVLPPKWLQLLIVETFYSAEEAVL